MTTILGIAGSLRAESINRRVLNAARYALPAGSSLHIWDGLAHVPPFDEDAEHGPVPDAVAHLRKSIAAADGLLIATPEYNSSVPGVLKNAVDWASRPYGHGVLSGKPVAVLSAGPSAYGASWAQAELRKVLASTGAVPVGAELAIPNAPQQIDEHDRLLDPELGESLIGVLRDLHRDINTGLAGLNRAG